jgi:tetratricopeptide (TPR) repeat protein
MLNPQLDSKLKHEKEKVLLVLCCLIILTVLLHIGFLENKFIDGKDLVRVVQNPLIRNISPIGFIHDIKGYYFFHYPSFFLTYFWGIIFSIWELNHIGFHFISFIIHTACTGLIFLLLFKLTGKIIPAFAGALFLGLHPFHCETVNWISRHDMMLSVLFGLFYLYLSLSKRRYEKILSVLFLLLAISVSPISILFLPGKYFLIPNDERSLFGWTSFIPIAGFFAVWGGKGSALLFHSNIITMAPKSLFFFLQGIFMPWKIHFMLPVLPSKPPFAGIVALFLIIATGWIALKLKSRELGALFLCFCSIWLLHAFSTRFNGGNTYFPLLWLSLAVGIGMNGIGMETLLTKGIVLLIVFTVFAACGFLSYRRNLAWRNTAYLLKDSLRVSPTDGWLLSMLGHYRASFLEKKEAEKIFKRVGRTSREILCLKAKAYHLLLQTKKSSEFYGKLFKKYPEMGKNKYCLFDYAVLNIQTNHLEEAKNLYREILGIDPYFIYAWHDLGTLFLQKEKGDTSIKYLKKVLEIAPAYRPTLENLAYFFMKKKKYGKAAEYIQVALDNTSCHDTQRFYREWLKALKEKKVFGFASLQWANLTPPG